MRRSKWNASDRNTAAAAVTYSDLPAPITSDILSRLPLTSIFRCKLVCKTWRNIIREPYFAKSHRSRSPPTLIFYRNGNTENSPSSHLEILQLHDPLVNSTIKFRTALLFPQSRTRIELEASCNGFILLSNGLSKNNDPVIIVFNPLRVHQVVLPKPPKLARKTMDAVRLGFGHCPSTDEYKVLRITTTTYRPDRFYCDIYTIGTDDEWRSIGVSGQPPAVIICQIVFLNGALHWIGDVGDSRFIYYFDMEKEQFGSFPLPYAIDKNCDYLSVVDNRLYLQNMDEFGECSLWAMKDYGDFGSWTLEWVIRRPINGGFEGFVNPLKTLKDGSLLVKFDKHTPKTQLINTTLASYNPVTRVLEKIESHVILPWSDLVADKPCFFSPMDAP